MSGALIKKKILRKLMKLFGSEATNTKPYKSAESDFSEFENEIVIKTQKYTMTSPVRVVQLIRAIDYLEQNKISGDIVECGVWRGGSIMAAILALNKYESIRNIRLYDIFSGMSEPTHKDRKYDGETAKIIAKREGSHWCNASLREVKTNISTMQYDHSKIEFIKGKVEETISEKNTGSAIALLRLDTDWYESTKHELKYLFPKLVKGGVLIIDDYGHWNGCRLAVDEYFKENNIKILLSRVDYTCRIGVKI